MASCGRDKNIWIWEKDEGEELGCSSILSGHSQVFYLRVQCVFKQ